MGRVVRNHLHSSWFIDQLAVVAELLYHLADRLLVSALIILLTHKQLSDVTSNYINTNVLHYLHLHTALCPKSIYQRFLNLYQEQSYKFELRRAERSLRPTTGIIISTFAETHENYEQWTNTRGYWSSFPYLSCIFELHFLYQQCAIYILHTNVNFAF